MLSLLLMNVLHGMDQGDQRKLPKVFVIPGQNGDGLDNDYVTQATGISPDRIQRVGTPASWWSTDLGQSGCMKHLKDALQDNEEEFIIYANSQGTATALNLLSQNPQYKEKCKGIVLEAVLGSGNSAIYHTITEPHTLKSFPSPSLCNFLKKVPGLYYVAPYFAKVLFPTHSPGGDQAIKSVENLDIDGPIIIAHSKADLQLSYEDACAIYYALRQNNKDVYLISKEVVQHINLFRNNWNPFYGPINDTSVKDILAFHGLSPAEISAVNPLNFSEYQPDLAELKPVHDELKAKERNHVWIKRML